MAHSAGEKATANEWSNRLIGAAIEVHRHLGPGLLESAYESCLGHELELLEIPFRTQVRMPLDYKGLVIPDAYRMDLLVADSVIVELKSVDRIEPVFEAQLLTYLRLSNRWLGLLINFNVPLLKDGIKRIVLG